MEKARTLTKRVFTMLLALVLVLGTLVPLAGTYEAQAATTAKISGKTIKKNGIDCAYVITGKSGVINGMKGVCADPWHHTGDATATVYEVPNTHDMARLAYYYTLKGWDPANSNATLGNSNSSRSLRMSQAMSYARVKTGFHTSKSISQWRSELKSQSISNTNINVNISLYNTALSAVPAGSVPDNFVVYLCVSSSKQDGLLYKLVPPGNVTLKKTSTDSSYATLPGYNNFSGIKYDLYKSDKSTKVGTFTVNANGTSNTITGLAPGTYYAKEVSTNAYYQLNSAWLAVTVNSNNTATLTASDVPVPGTAKIIKKEASGRAIEAGVSFTFTLTNRTSGKTYTVTVTGDGSSTASGTVSVPAGTYDVVETAYPNDWIDTTGAGTLVVEPGETAEIEWTNRQPGEGFLTVKKTTEDNGPLAGFTFRVEGVLYNQGELTATEFLAAADPQATLTDTDNYEAPGSWTVNSDDLAALNEAAANRESGEFSVRLTSSAKHKEIEGQTVGDIVDAIDPEPTAPGNGTITEGTVIKDSGKTYKAKSDVEYEYAGETDEETDDYTFDKDATKANIKALLEDTSKFEVLDTDDLNISLTVKVNLSDVDYDSEDKKFVDSVKNPVAKTGSGEGYEATYNDFDWHGAATIYKDMQTGNAYTILITDNEGLTRVIEDGISKGKFTVTEQMTEAQAARYHQPEAQEKEITEGDFAAFSFDFVNSPYWTPVKLKKTSPDGNIEGLEFRLTGTTAFGDHIERSGITDAEGNIDFGNIHKGSYVVEETSFDPNNYVNNHKLSGYENPAIAFEVTGEETEDIVIEFDNRPITTLYISKIDGDSHEFLENAVFELYEDGELAARFQVVTNDDGSAGINMIWSNGVIEGHMSKTIVDPEPEEDVIIDPIPEIDDDEEIIVADPEGDQGGDDGSGAASGGSEDNPIDYDSLNWARLDNLSLGKTYTLKETRAPSGGYLATATVEFEMDALSKRIVVENFIPEIGTTANDSETQNHIANADSSVTITDKVAYKHVAPNTEYVLKGYLIKIEDNTGSTTIASPVIVNGQPVEVTKHVTSNDEGTGEWEMEFTFDASELKGFTTVVCEELYTTGGSFVAIHSDADDEGQSIHFPEIKTTAKDPDSQYHDLGAISETETIVDTVAYTNLLPGETYTMKGTLYDKTTGEFITDSEGNTYTVEQEFTAEAADGTVDLTFTVNSTDLVSHKIVVFEECLIAVGDEAVVVGEHKDKNDEDQTIEYPNPTYNMYKIRVNDASEKGDTGKYGFKAGDTVYYEVHVINTGNVEITCDVRDEFNGDAAKLFSEPVIESVSNALQSQISENRKTANITIDVGQTAIVTFSAEPLPGTPEYLANAPGDSDSEDKDGNDVNRVDEQNNPDNNDGYWNTAYTENPTYPNPGNPDENLPVPEGDKDDVAQTPVREPEIGTTLTGKMGRKEIKPGESTKLVDTIAYEGLTPGQTYAVVGTLMVKKTEDPLVEHGEPVVATGYFTPTTENGTTSVTFVVDTTGLQGKELVAFEVCYNISGHSGEEISSPEGIEENGIKVASHEDINDKGQTIRVKSTPSTGDDNMMFLWYGVTICAAAFVSVLALLMKKRAGMRSDI